MLGAIEAMAKLRANPALTVYILTAPSVENPLCYSEKREWVEAHLGMDMVRRLIISPDKGLSRGHYLIDDHIKGRGQDRFEGQLIHFGSTEFPSWVEVLQVFA
jgi:5'(3')-deoxyribonucleotidase